ncbi:MAG TPA: hypothetical protein VII13_00065 [Vicinamibacteria bacterium]|jgi:hypothetical protein
MNIELLREALGNLTDLAPTVAARVEAVAQEAEAAQGAVEEFLRTLLDRQAEGAALFGRLEAALADVRREAEAAGELRIPLGGQGEGASTRNPAEVLEDPNLSFEDRLFLFSVTLMRRQEERIEEMATAWTTRKEAEKSLLASSTDEAEAGVRTAGDGLNGAFEEAVLEGAGLRGTLQGSRESLAAEFERLAAEMETVRMQQSRDVDDLGRDLAGIESNFSSRLERNRDAIRLDGDRIEEETDRQTTHVEKTLRQALDEVGGAVNRLNGLLRRANEESQEDRRDLAPAFKDLEHHIGILKQAVESVREAARSVGLPY